MPHDLISSSRGGHAWRARPGCERFCETVGIEQSIQNNHAGIRETYGCPSVHAELRPVILLERYLVVILDTFSCKVIIQMDQAWQLKCRYDWIAVPG
jgi:hypothetical protein